MSKAEHIEVEVITFNPNAATVAAFSQTEKALAALEAKHKDVIYPVSTPEELAIAESALKEVKKYRTTLESHRKETKSPVIAYGKLIDTEASRLESRILAIEKPLQKVIDAEKAKAELARQAAEQAALERLQEFDRMIAEIKNRPALCANLSAKTLSLAIEKMRADVPHIGKFFEKTGEAIAAHTDALKELEAMFERQTKAEADQAELERLRKLQAEADAEAKRKEDEQAAALAAMQKQIDEANAATAKAQKEAADAEAKRQAAENKRLADEQAELDKKNAPIAAVSQKNDSPVCEVVADAVAEAHESTEADPVVSAIADGAVTTIRSVDDAIQSVIADLDEAITAAMKELSATQRVNVYLVAAKAALSEQPNLDCAWMLQDAIEGAKSI